MVAAILILAFVAIAFAYLYGNVSGRQSAMVPLSTFPSPPPHVYTVHQMDNVN